MKYIPGQPITPVSARVPYGPVGAIAGLESGDLTGGESLQALADLMNAGVLMSPQGSYHWAWQYATDAGYIRRGPSGQWIASYPGVDGSTTD